MSTRYDDDLSYLNSVVHWGLAQVLSHDLHLSRFIHGFGNGKNIVDPNQLASSTVCEGMVHPGSAGPGLIKQNEKSPLNKIVILQSKKHID